MDWSLTELATVAGVFVLNAVVMIYMARTLKDNTQRTDPQLVEMNSRQLALVERMEENDRISKQATADAVLQLAAGIRALESLIALLTQAQLKHNQDAADRAENINASFTTQSSAQLKAMHEIIGAINVTGAAIQTQTEQIQGVGKMVGENDKEILERLARIEQMLTDTRNQTNQRLDQIEAEVQNVRTEIGKGRTDEITSPPQTAKSDINEQEKPHE